MTNDFPSPVGNVTRLAEKNVMRPPRKRSLLTRAAQQEASRKDQRRKASSTGETGPWDCTLTAASPSCCNLAADLQRL